MEASQHMNGIRRFASRHFWLYLLIFVLLMGLVGLVGGKLTGAAFGVDGDNDVEFGGGDPVVIILPAICKPGHNPDLICSPADFVKAFTANKLGRTNGLHPNTRFANPAAARDTIAHKIANKLSTLSAADQQALSTDLGMGVVTLSCGPLCRGFKFVDKVFSDSNCDGTGDAGRFLGLSSASPHVCPRKDDDAPPIPQKVIDGGVSIALCGAGVAVGISQLSGPGLATKILLVGGVGGGNCYWNFWLALK